MTTAREVAKGLSRREWDALEDLCACPGLFAGQYDDLDRLPEGLVLRRYEGASGFLGLAKAWPTDLALSILEEGKDG